MIKYFCNKCEKEITIGRYLVCVKDAKGNQENYHYHTACMKEILKALTTVVKEDSEEPKSVKDDVEVVAWTKTEDEKLQERAETAERLRSAIEEPKQEEKSDNADETPKEEVKEPAEQVEEKVEAPKVPRVKPRAALKTDRTKNSDDAEKATGGPGSLTLSPELPKPPRKDAKADRARRVLIEFYKGVAPRTIQERNKIAPGDYYYILKRYGSQVIKDRYSQDKEWLDDKGNAVKWRDLLSLYSGGFSMDRIANEEFYIDIALVNKIVNYYTGI